MRDFYELLSVDKKSSQDEIRQALKRERHIWRGRINTNNVWHRQEAERMLKALEEAERVLLDPARRQQYDQARPTTSTGIGLSPQVEVAEDEDLLSRGWDLLIEDRMGEALVVATRATERDPQNAAAWALLGQVKFHLGEKNDAIYEYKRAITLSPNEASYYYDLGCVYASEKCWDEANDQFRRATQLDPESVWYRSSLGAMECTRGNFAEGISLLERCVQEEPESQNTRWFLADAYIEASYQNWTYVPEGRQDIEAGWYATTKEHVTEALNYLGKAERLNVDDLNLAQEIREHKANVQKMLSRRFHGNLTAGIVAIIFGFLTYSVSKDPKPFLIYSGSGLFYFFACLTPIFVLNHKFIKGRGQIFSREQLAEAYRKEGWAAWLGALLPLIALMPIMAGWNFIKNYVFENTFNGGYFSGKPGRVIAAK